MKLHQNCCASQSSSGTLFDALFCDCDGPFIEKEDPVTKEKRLAKVCRVPTCIALAPCPVHQKEKS